MIDSFFPGGRRERFVSLAAVLIVLALVWLYYRLEWGSVGAFVSAIDTCDRLFCDFIRHFRPMGKAVLSSAAPVTGYLYTAFFTLVLVPFGAVSEGLAVWLWGAVQAALAALLLILPIRGLVRVGPRGAPLYVLLFATSFPILHNFKWGQVSVLVTLCIAGSFLAYRRERRILAGVLLALGAAVKYYPAIFVIYFLLRRDTRAIGAFIFSLAVFFFVVPALLMGPATWWTFQKASFSAIPDASLIARNPNSQYFAYVASRLMSSGAGGAAMTVLRILGYAVACANLGLLWIIQRIETRGKVTLSAALIFLTLPFLLQTSWPHYFVYLPLCQAGLFSCIVRLPSDDRIRGKMSGGTEGSERTCMTALCATVVCSAALSSVFVFNLFPHWTVYSRYGILFISDFLALLALYGFVSMLLRRDPFARQGEEVPVAA